MNHIRRNWQIALLTLVVCAALLSPLLLGRNLLKTYKTIAQNLMHIRQTTLTQRQADTYADFGYAYIMQVWQYYPQRDHFPTVRYTNSSHNVQLLLPEIVSYTDSNVILAVDVPATDFQERDISALELRNTASEVQQTWTFTTKDDYDTLTGFTLVPQVCADSQQMITIDVFNTVDAPKPLTTTSLAAQCLAGAKITAPLNSYLHGLSFSRGGVPFKVQITTSSPVQWQGLTALGIKIDTAGFTLINQEDNNYTFMRDDILPSSTWQEFLARNRNV